MDDWYRTICAGHHLPASTAETLLDQGFAIIAGPVAPERLPRFAEAYERAMNSGSEADWKVGSTTTRLYDFVNRGDEFDDVYIYPPLLEACSLVIGAPFKLSSTLGRTLRAHAGAQDLHIDLPRGSEDQPMLGFILMVDEFRRDNGATRFVPGSHTWAAAPEDLLTGDRKAACDGEVLACGPSGSLILFAGAVWHGHTANSSGQARRSIQGYFVRREARSGIDLSARMLPETLNRIGPLARYVLAL